MHAQQAKFALCKLQMSARIAENERVSELYMELTWHFLFPLCFFIFIFVFAIFYLIAHVSSVRLVNSVLNFIFIFIRLFVCTAFVPVRVFFLPCCFQFAGVNPFLGIPQSTYVRVCVKFILEHTHMPAHTHK